MFARFPLALFLTALLCGCGRPSSPETCADDQTFTFASVKYTAGGKTKTQKFEKGRVTIDPDAVTNAITLQGSYGPGDSNVTAIEVGTDISITPIFKDGKWSATIDADKLKTNIVYRLKPVVKEGSNSPESAKLGIGAK